MTPRRLRKPNTLWSARPRWHVVFGVLTILCVSFGVAARVFLLRSGLGALSSDEAVVGLMAEHVLRGEHPTFYWGQSYGGTLEVYLVAGVFKVFGASTLALKLVPIALWAVASILVWRIAGRFVDGSRARLAGALFWAIPVYSVWKSEHEDGFYGVSIVCSALILLIALRLAARSSVVEFALLGFVIGLGWWSNPLILIVAVPSMMWLFLRHGLSRRALALAPGLALGAMPWLFANVGRGWPSLHPRTDNSPWFDRLHALVSATLPSALGLRVPYSLLWLPGIAIGAVLYAAVLVAFGRLVLRRRRELGLLLLACVTLPPIYVAAQSSLHTEPRYLVLLFPVITLLFVVGPQRNATTFAIAAGALGLSVGGLVVMASQDAARPEVGGVLVPARFGGLVSVLQADGVSRLYADYWVAFRLTFESHESIIAAPSAQVGYRIANRTALPNDESEGRWPPYTRAVRAAPEAAHVFIAGDERESVARPVLLHAGYRCVRAAGFDVYLSRNPLRNKVKTAVRDGPHAGIARTRQPARLARNGRGC